MRPSEQNIEQVVDQMLSLNVSQEQGTASEKQTTSKVTMRVSPQERDGPCSSIVLVV